MTAAIQQTAPRERPISFKAEMVRAILAGTKTQTRRVISPQPEIPEPVVADLQRTRPGVPLWALVTDAWQSGFVQVRCPYGVPGDRLWLQEGYQLSGTAGEEIGCRYLADGAFALVRLAAKDRAKLDARRDPHKAQPGRFMYRSISRITLEVTEVAVQRVQDISEEDAIAEGIDQPREIGPGLPLAYRDYLDPERDLQEARASFASLWDSINAARGFGWDANPWVWAIGFRRVQS